MLLQLHKFVTTNPYITDRNYQNLTTVQIYNDGEGGYQIPEFAGAMYDETTTTIITKEKNKFSDIAMHEAIHALTLNNDHPTDPFCMMNFPSFAEGMTALITLEYYDYFPNSAYPSERALNSVLIDLVGKEAVLESFTNCDMTPIVNALKPYLKEVYPEYYEQFAYQFLYNFENLAEAIRNSFQTGGIDSRAVNNFNQYLEIVYQGKYGKDKSVKKDIKIQSYLNNAKMQVDVKSSPNLPEYQVIIGERTYNNPSSETLYVTSFNDDNPDLEGTFEIAIDDYRFGNGTDYYSSIYNLVRNPNLNYNVKNSDYMVKY